MTAFRCYECSADRPLELRALAPGAAVYVCADCASWFPVIEDIPDFCPEGSRDEERWRLFWEEHGERAGLREPRAVPASRNKQVQREFFDSAVGDYEHVLATNPFWLAHDDLALHSWVARVPSSAAVIDLGAGSGRCTVPLADSLAADAQIVAVDISFEMLREAARKLDARGTRERVQVVVGDCTQLGFLPDAAFDVAFSYGLLHHLDDPAPVFTALDRIMRPAASILIHDNNASGMRALFDRMMSRKPLWVADHEGHPVVALRDLKGWAADHGFAIEARTSVFLPPQLLSRMSVRTSRRVLELTDRSLSRLPGVRAQGGLILAEAFRGRRPLVFDGK